VTQEFNLILEALDKNNQNLHWRMMCHSRCLPNDVDLKEQNLVGRIYTCSNERKARTMEKLDKMVLHGGLGWGPSWMSATSPFLILVDHYTIMMSMNVFFRRRPRFQFQSFWPAIDEFHKAASTMWFAVEEHHDPSVDSQNHLRETPKLLTRCSQRMGWNIKEKILVANEVIL
jgi:hypothetical protein